MKTIKLFFLLNFLFFTSLLFAQVTTKNFDHKDFFKVKVSGNFNVNIKKGDVFKILVTGEKKDVDEVVSDLKNGEVVINFERKAIRPRRTNIEITLPRLQAVNFDGSIRADVAPGFMIDFFNIYIMGSAELKVEIDAQKIYADLSGSSTLEVKGKGEEIQANVGGASMLQAFDFHVEEAKLDVGGTGGARVTVSTVLTANTSGTGKIRYRGSPSQIQNNAKGFSSIKKDGQ